MINNDYWNLFAQNGSIEAYLAYKGIKKLTNKNDRNRTGERRSPESIKGNNIPL